MSHYTHEPLRHGIHLVDGLLHVDTLPPISGVQAKVYVDSDGVFHRIVG